MRGDAVQHPASVERAREWLASEQAEINHKRVELLEQFGSMRPPQASKSFVQDCHKEAELLNQRLGG